MIENLASYYAGKEASNTDVANFMQKYFAKYNNRFLSISFCKSFYGIFRHGLVHNWAPKNAAVAMNFNDPRYFHLMKHNNKETACINMPAFYMLTQMAFTDYHNDLNVGKSVEEYEKRYKSIQHDSVTAIEAFMKTYKETDKLFKVVPQEDANTD